MRGGKGEQKSSETLGLLRLFSVFIHWVTVLFKKSFWKMLQHFLFFAKLRSARGPFILGGPPGPLGPRGPRPPARIGSKASWQIALGPHECAYTRLVAFGVRKIFYELTHRKTVSNPQRDILKNHQPYVIKY